MAHSPVPSLFYGDNSLDESRTRYEYVLAA